MNFFCKFKYILIFCAIFLVFFVFSYIYMPVFCDEIWSYGFSYNISLGMVIYRDFNVLQTPLYFFIGSLFIKVFGSYLISLGILNSILISLMGIMLFRIIKWKFLVVLPILLIAFPSGYNLLLLFFVVLIIYLINIGRENDVLIGLIVGLMFLTKQNIGGVMFIISFLISKNKIKFVSSFLLPILFLLIYLVCNDALFEFVDYAFLGLFSFNENNKSITLYGVVFEILICGYLIYKLFKCKFKDRELIYILGFQIICYPIFDERHLVCGLFLFLYVFLKNLDIFLGIVGVAMCVFWFNFMLACATEISVHKQRDIFYLRNSFDLSYRLEKLNDYLVDLGYDLENDSYYFAEFYGYLFKLYHNIPINQYDFLIDGNIGYYGKEKRFQEIIDDCNERRCIFFVDENFMIDNSQFVEFSNFIIENYEKIDDLYNLDVYSNEGEYN